MDGLYQRSLSGFRGELSLDYPLCFLPEDQFSIFHDLRLCNEDYFFQIDFLLICRRFILLLEVKNIAGQLTFDTDFAQLIRRRGESLDTFNDPLTQVENLNQQLRHWLKRQCGVQQIPVLDRVVIASSAALDASDRRDPQIKKIIRRDNLKRELLKINEQYGDKIITPAKIRKIEAALLEDHRERRVDLLQRFKIRADKILKGAICPACGFLPLEYSHQRWRCSKCGHVTRRAQYSALRDYYLIFGPMITNQECRSFLLANSNKSAQRWIQTMSERFEGNTKGRIYYLSWDKIVEACSVQ